MLGLAPVVLPEGRPYIHNCSDVDETWSYKQEVVLKKKEKKPHVFHPAFLAATEKRSADVKEKYRAIFAKYGGKLTMPQLSKELGVRLSVAWKWFDYHENKHVRRAGKIKKTYVWEWIDDGNE